MRVAICFFGITRNLGAYTLDSIEKCLFAPIARHDSGYKKFCHFNLVRKISNPRSGEQNVPVEPMDFELLKCDAAAQTEQTWLDHHLAFEAIEKFGDVFEDKFLSLRNLVRQLYSLRQVTDLLVESGEYFDLVIYSRADLRFHAEIAIPTIEPHTLYAPWFDKGGGV